MNRRLQVTKYAMADYLSALAAWTAFYIYRKKIIEPEKFGYPVPVEFDERFFTGALLIPIFWLSLYTMLGMYRNIYRRHRLRELGQVMLASCIGVVVLFFALLLDDAVANYQYYYKSVAALLTIHFSVSFVPRFVLTSRTVKHIHSGKWGFNTIIIGGNEEALNVYREMRDMKPSPGFKFIGYVSVNGKDMLLEEELTWLGNIKRIKEVVEREAIEEVIIAMPGASEVTVFQSGHFDSNSVFQLNEPPYTGINAVAPFTVSLPAGYAVSGPALPVATLGSRRNDLLWVPASTWRGSARGRIPSMAPSTVT